MTSTNLDLSTIQDCMSEDPDVVYLTRRTCDEQNRGVSRQNPRSSRLGGPLLLEG